MFTEESSDWPAGGDWGWCGDIRELGVTLDSCHQEIAETVIIIMPIAAS